MQERPNSEENIPYSLQEIEKLKEALKDREDGRYEKRRSGKKNNRPDNNEPGSFAISDIFPGKENLTPIIKQGDRYFAVIDKLGEGDFGKVKYAIDLDSKKVYVLKTQEAFMLAKDVAKFDPKRVNDELGEGAVPLDVLANKLKQIKDLSTIKGNIKDSLTEEERSQILEALYFIYKNMIPHLINGNADHLGGFDRVVANLPAYTVTKDGIHLPISREPFDVEADASLNDLLKQIKACIPELETQTEKEKFENTVAQIEERANLEAEALHAMNRGTGLVIKRMVHRDVTNQQGKSVQDVQYNLLMDYIPGQSLYDIIKGKKNYDEATRLRIAKGIIDDWLRLKNAGFYHCDLKPDNIKYDPNTGQVTLIDFGSVSKIDSNGIASTATFGAPSYAAPERGRYSSLQQAATEKSEVFSIGTILRELTDDMDSVLDPLSESMISYEASKRPTMQQVLNSINELLLEQEVKQEIETLTPESEPVPVQKQWISAERKTEAPQKIPLSKAALQGQQFVELILRTKQITDLSLDQIQFNFCLRQIDGQSMPESKAEILAAMSAFLESRLGQKYCEDYHITKEEILAIQMPENASQLNSYVTTLSARASSFAEAGIRMIENIEQLPRIELNAMRHRIKHMNAFFQENIKLSELSDEKRQAYYNAYIESLKEIIKDGLQKSGIKIKDKTLTKELGSAETLCNIVERKAQFTFSGKVGESVHVQMDEPRNKFSDLDLEQKREWIRTYLAYQTLKGQTIALPKWMTGNEKYRFASDDINKHRSFEMPPWFLELPKWEQSEWMSRMAKVMDDAGNDSVPMGPVVKKGGVPGLRNAFFSSFATLTYNNNHLDRSFVTPKTLRTSNLIAQAKEGQAELTIDQTSLTEANLKQIASLYQKESNDKNFPWTWGPGHQNITLCQTLLRLKGGGDDYVIEHKDRLVRDASKNGTIGKYLTSNHCIGGSVLLKQAFALAGANTSGIQHLLAPINDFIENAVLYHYAKTSPESVGAIRDAINKLYLAAIEGNLKLSPIVDPKMASVMFVFGALSDYVKTEQNRNDQQNYQLHLAALEEIIYQHSGHRVQSSCKSGKDREGILKCYRNAMTAFYHLKGTFPPLDAGSPERKLFVDIFIELFKSNHQARLAELNARGCHGLKALKNILPSDIYQELAQTDLLKQHAKNSALNDLGKSKVESDKSTFKDAITIYKKEMKKASSAIDKEEVEKFLAKTIPEIGHYGTSVPDPMLAVAKPEMLDSPVEENPLYKDSTDYLTSHAKTVDEFIKDHGLAIDSKELATQKANKTFFREQFIRYLAVVYAREDNECTASALSRKNDPKSEAILMEKLLGSYGTKLYEAALKEEVNSKQFMDAILDQSKKTYEGQSWAKRPIVIVAGPSASGKTYAANNAIVEASKYLERSPEDQPGINEAIFIDGGKAREVSQMRKLVLNVANDKGYPGILDLNSQSTELGKVKDRVYEFALHWTNCGMVMPETFANPLKKRHVVKDVLACENATPIFTRVDGQDKNIFRDVVAYMGTSRAWLRDGFVKKDSIGLNDNPVCESKGYQATWFSRGVSRSEAAEEEFARLNPNALRMLITNDLILIRKENNAWVNAKSGDENVVLISKRVFDRWLNNDLLMKRQVNGEWVDAEPGDRDAVLVSKEKFIAWLETSPESRCDLREIQERIGSIIETSSEVQLRTVLKELDELIKNKKNPDVLLQLQGRLQELDFSDKDAIVALHSEIAKRIKHAPNSDERDIAIKTLAALTSRINELSLKGSEPIIQETSSVWLRKNPTVFGNHSQRLFKQPAPPVNDNLIETPVSTKDKVSPEAEEVSIITRRRTNTTTNERADTPTSGPLVKYVSYTDQIKIKCIEDKLQEWTVAPGTEKGNNRSGIYYRVTKDSREFTVHQQTFKARGVDEETYIAMLKAFKAVNVESELPHIMTTSAKAKAAWENALNVVYPHLNLNELKLVRIKNADTYVQPMLNHQTGCKA